MCKIGGKKRLSKKFIIQSPAECIANDVKIMEERGGGGGGKRGGGEEGEGEKEEEQ